MGILSSIRQFFGFTPRETRAVLFLTMTFLAGLVLRAYNEQQASERPAFDYAKDDSLFVALSAELLEPEAGSQPDRKGGRNAEPLLPRSIDLNAATKEELIRLPGIGPSYAERIIDFREKSGGFKTIEELEKVKGIGKKTVERLRPFLILGNRRDTSSP